MKNDGFFRKRGTFAILFMVLFATAKSQVMWNLKGGWMSREAYFYDTHSSDNREKENFQEWMAGLGIEIPLNDKLNLETGLRYKRHHSFVENEYTIKTVGSSYTQTENRQFEAKSLIELPLRLTYKQPLGKDFSLHVGVGPYMSFIPDGSWRFYRNENNTNNGWSDSKWGDQLQVGLEPSVAINWKCLSLGATYNIPCFYKGYKDENKPVVMATLGIRFKSSAWRYVGATLLTIVTVGGAAASAWSSAVEANQNYSSGYYGSSSYSSGSNSSSGGNYETMYRKWEKQAQNVYNSLAGHSGGTVTYQKNMELLRNAQKEMAKWRNKARKAGIMIPQSEWETKKVPIY
ncbi:MAG: outer membrane beta-barrel protein [Prevotella sp.]|nr:outer membrane beta-barrel protein [Prevotella sp.]